MRARFGIERQRIAAARDCRSRERRQHPACASAGPAGLGRPATVNSKLLLVADALKRGADSEAVQLLSKSSGGADLGFWEPMVRAWNAAERRDSAGALAILNAVPRSSAFAPFVDEQAALILLRLRKPAEAAPYASRALAMPGRASTASGWR
jgi:hypothetical protein